MTQSDFFNKYYKRLYKSIKNVTKEEKEQLLTQLYLDLDKKWDKLKELPEEEIVKLSCRMVYNQYTWNNSPHNVAQKLISNTAEIFSNHSEKHESSYSIEIQAENTGKLALEWLQDLKSIYTEKQIEKLINLQLILHVLQPHEKILYQMYFYDNLSCREIAEKVKLNMWTTSKMVTEMKNKLKQALNEDKK